MSEEVLLDLGFLTEEERDIINGVIFKDIEMRKQEQSRIGYLRNELDHLKEVGLPENEIEIKNEEYCARCQTYFGIIWNRGAFCPRCELKVCKTCRQNVAEEGWMCTLCFKVREVKAQSGAWFFEGHKKKDANLFGSMLVRKSLRRLPGSQSGAADEQKQRKNRPSANTNGFNHHQQIHGDDDYTAEHYNHYDRRIPYNSPGTADHVSQNPRTDEHEKRGLTYSDASESDSDEGTTEDYFSPETISVGSERSHSRGKGGSDSSESLESDHEDPTTKKLQRVTQEAVTTVAEEITYDDQGRESDGNESLERRQEDRPAKEPYRLTQEVNTAEKQAEEMEITADNQVRKSIKVGIGAKSRFSEDADNQVGTLRDTPDHPENLREDDSDIFYTPAPKFNIPNKRRQLSDSGERRHEVRGENDDVGSTSEGVESPKSDSLPVYRPKLDSASELPSTAKFFAPQQTQQRYSESESDDNTWVEETSRASEDVGTDLVRSSEVAGGSEKNLRECDVSDQATKEDITEVSEEPLVEEEDKMNEGSSSATAGNGYTLYDVSKRSRYRLTKQIPTTEEEICQENEDVVESSSGDVLEANEQEGSGEGNTAGHISGNSVVITSEPVPDRNIPQNSNLQEDEEGNLDGLSVLARVKNWERRSTGDGYDVAFDRSSSPRRSTDQEEMQSAGNSELKGQEKFDVTEEYVRAGLAGESDVERVSWPAKRVSGETKATNDESDDRSDVGSEIDDDEISPGANKDDFRAENTTLNSDGSESSLTELGTDKPEKNVGDIGVGRELPGEVNDDGYEREENDEPSETDKSELLEEDCATPGSPKDHSTSEMIGNPAQGWSESVPPGMDVDLEIVTRDQDKVTNVESAADESQLVMESGIGTPPAEAVPESTDVDEGSLEPNEGGRAKSECNLKSSNTDLPSTDSNLTDEITQNTSSLLTYDTFIDLESSHGQRDAETKPENDSSMWNVDLYESRPGEKRLSAEEPDVDVDNVQIEEPQAPGKEYGVSEVMETAETEQEIVGGGTKSSEVSSTAEEPNSLESRGNALRAFSESFASMSTDQYGEKHPEDLPGSHAVDPFDDRRSSDPRLEAHGAFNIDNDSGISDTSKYVTPTPSEDTSSKRTSSLSGDEGRTTPTNDGQLQTEEMAPVIVTTAPEKTPKSNRSSITDYGEDHDVSFSKYGATLGNRKLKDQLSMGSRESIVSYYSNAGGEVYGKYPVSGEIYFGIKYDAKIQEFQVQVHQARDITAVDQKNNVSDPYVKTYLLPDRTRTGKRKTKVKKNTINPVFDEILTYKISYDEILQRTLWLAVWNYDRFGHNDFLGEVLLPIDEYHQSGYSLEDPEPQWYDLCERQTDDSLLSYNGEIVLALKYVPPSAVVSKKKKKKKKGEEEKGELHVNIIEATNLIAKDSNGFSDPFCKSYLLPDKSKKTKQKTAVVKKNLNPKWNYHFVYEHLTREELLDRVLELTVWDYDRGSSNEFLGGVRLGLGAGIQEWDDANEEEKAAWNVMLNNQNDWNQVTLTLRDNMGQHKYHASAIDLGDRVDSSLLEVQPKTQTSAQDQFDVSLSSQASSRATDPRSDNPDEGLTHHREYHSPLASKIATEIKSLNARRSSPSLTGKESLGHTRMTLAELAKMGTTPAVTEPSPPVTAAPTDKVRVEISPSEYSSSELLIRHSEFYKGSKSPNVSRPKSADSPASFQDILQEQRPTLVDMLQRNEDVVSEEYNLPGSSLMVGKDFMGSRESVYSNAGMFSNNSVSGEIFLGYQYSSGTFKIKIFEARGLTAIDKHKNTSDPYVKVYLLPDQSRAGKRKTKIKHGTLHPEFNEEMLYKIGIIELLTRTMWVSLWNYDRFGRNEFLGEVRIPLGDYKGFDEHPKWYTLSEMDPVSAADNQGELVVALMYSPEEKKKKKGTNKGRLHVKIVEARNLPGKDSDNLSDPFCKSYLLPDPGKKTKKKTPVMKRNLNPRWDHKFTYDNVSLEELQGRVLELTVWDHDLGSSNDFLGGVRIGLGTSDEEWDDCEGEEVALWQFLLSKPNTWTQSTLSLRSQMGYRKGLKT